jgi:hypothetical protein
MRSNFKSPLKIKNGVVKAKGDFNWGTGEKEARVSVSIFQRGHKVADMATSPEEFKRPAKSWTVDVGSEYEPGYPTFKPGPAEAIGIVCAMGNEARVSLWTQPVDLKY